MKLSEYVTQVINDPKYGHDLEWVKGNLARTHIEAIEDAHDAEVRAEAESDPAKDERLVRYIAMATPLGYQSALTVVQQMTLMIQAETEARRASVVAEAPEWEYGWHTGSTVSLIGRRDQVEEWLAVRGWKLGEGDWGSRVMRRRVAGSWVPAEQEGADDV